MAFYSDLRDTAYGNLRSAFEKSEAELKQVRRDSAKQLRETAHNVAGDLADAKADAKKAADELSAVNDFAGILAANFTGILTGAMPAACPNISELPTLDIRNHVGKTQFSLLKAVLASPERVRVAANLLRPIVLSCMNDRDRAALREVAPLLRNTFEPLPSWYVNEKEYDVVLRRMAGLNKSVNPTRDMVRVALFLDRRYVEGGAALVRAYQEEGLRLLDLIDPPPSPLVSAASAATGWFWVAYTSAASLLSQ